ncbi:unnamed protein product, partial [Symbiodinium necroappetens]
ENEQEKEEAGERDRDGEREKEGEQTTEDEKDRTEREKDARDRADEDAGDEGQGDSAERGGTEREKEETQADAGEAAGKANKGGNAPPEAQERDDATGARRPKKRAKGRQEERGEIGTFLLTQKNTIIILLPLKGSVA